MYNQLPSTVLKYGTTFDIMVSDVYTTWEKVKTDPNAEVNYDEDSLMEIMKSVRGDNVN
jgi:hypothetical protein